MDIDAGRADLIFVQFVRCVFFFSSDDAPRPQSCGLEKGSLSVPQTFPRWLPLNVPGFHLKILYLGAAADQASVCARLRVLAGAT